jgi:hypothetical protein
MQAYFTDRLRERFLWGLVVSLAVCLIIPDAAGGADLALIVRGGLSDSHFAGTDYDHWLTGEGYDHSANWRGAVGGLGIVYGFGRFVAAQADLLYVDTGSESISGWLGSYHYDHIRTLELPVTAVLRYRFATLELYLLAGPSMSLRIGPVEYLSDTGGGTWPESQFGRFAVGYVWGGGFNLHFRGGFFLSFDGRKYNGLTSIRNVVETGLEDWNQESLQVTVGLGKFLTGEAAKFRGRSRVR